MAYFPSGGITIAELAARYEISRKTAYKWIARYAAGGPAALEDRPSTAVRVANRTPLEIEALVVAFKLKHPNWGPKKTLDCLKRLHPDMALPLRIPAIVNTHSGDRDQSEATLPGWFLWCSSLAGY